MVEQKHFYDFAMCLFSGSGMLVAFYNKMYHKLFTFIWLSHTTLPAGKMK